MQNASVIVGQFHASEYKIQLHHGLNSALYNFTRVLVHILYKYVIHLVTSSSK